MQNVKSTANLLKELDTVIYSGGVGVVRTNRGLVSVRPAPKDGYVAELGDGDTPEAMSYGLTPAMAFMSLSSDLTANHQMPGTGSLLINAGGM